MRPVRLLLLALLVAVAAQPAAGQQAVRPTAAWDAPSFMPPRGIDDVGVYVFEPSGGEWGVSGIWRQSGNLGLGVRGGILDIDATASRAFLAGLEFFGPLLAGGLPLDMAWVLGAGGTFYDGGTTVRLPAGVTAGVRLGSPGFVLVPYVHPRAALALWASGDESETRFEATVDLGLDLLLGDAFRVRVGAAFGDGNALGAGVALRFARGVAVR
jgi:hypothetical protein